MSDNINRKLWEAALAGDEALVSQLIEQATVDWRDGSDYTALHPAAYGGHTPVVTRLLDAGWSLEARSGAGFTPLTKAAAGGDLETVKYLLVREPTWTPRMMTRAPRYIMLPTVATMR